MEDIVLKVGCICSHDGNYWDVQLSKGLQITSTSALPTGPDYYLLFNVTGGQGQREFTVLSLLWLLSPSEIN